jgi:endoglucanase
MAAVERALNASWESYRREFIAPDGRVAIPERGGDSISEAQAYALLRALWAGDEPTFQRVYAWTWRHLSRQRTQGDELLAWHWGRGEDGAFRVKDWNTAADGNLDYALALMLAARRGWKDPIDAGVPGYQEVGARVLEGVLALETVRLPDGRLLLTPGNWRDQEPPYLINPSYFSPAAYRLFEERQPGRGWLQLRDSTYDLVALLLQGLGEVKGVGLFPDWCRVDAAGRPEPAPGRDSHFGWEAVRLPWRLALDSLWFKEQRATDLLTRGFLSFMKSEWQSRGRLAAQYSFKGEALAGYESPVLYAGVLAGALAAGDGDFAGELAGRILSFYRQEGGRAYFVTPDNYYANNWAWLGLALYAGRAAP